MKIVDEEFKNYELAKVSIGELHLSSQKDLQLPNGKRFPRDQLEKGQEDSSYACESKIIL